VLFTRVVRVATAVSLAAGAAACSTGTTTDGGAAAGTGTPAPAESAPRPLASPSGGPAGVTRPRVLSGHAPAAAGVEVAVRRLETRRPGGRVTGLSTAGVAVGVEGSPAAPPTGADGLRAVRWEADGRRRPLPAGGPSAEPRIGPDGLVAVTTLRTGPGGAIVWDAKQTPNDVTAETGDGTRPRDRDVAAVVDVGKDAVLVTLRQKPNQPSSARNAPAGLWSPRTGEVTRVPVRARFLTADGAVVGDRADGEGDGPAVWRPDPSSGSNGKGNGNGSNGNGNGNGSNGNGNGSNGNGSKGGSKGSGGSLTALEVPRGWRGDPYAGAGDTVVGKITRGTEDPRALQGDPAAQPPAAAVAWKDGRLQYLPPLGGRQSIAVAVNRHGVAVGTSRTPDPDGWPHAVMWREGRVTDLGTLDGEGESWAVDVSDADIAVGYSSTRGGGRHAVAWVRGGILDLGAAVDPAAKSQADGVVDRRVYGRVTGTDGVDAPVIWTLGGEAANRG
jgi:probable HAF family extracellular repeat protein